MSERKRENSEMHAWNQTNIGEKFEGTKMRKELIRATFQQAKEDGVTVLEIGYRKNICVCVNQVA